MKMFFVVWSGGLEEPQIQGFMSEQEAHDQADEWSEDMGEFDRIDVFSIDEHAHVEWANG